MHKENIFTAKIPGYIRPHASSGGVSKSALTHLAVQHQSECLNGRVEPPTSREKLSKRQRGKCSSVVCAPPSLYKSLGGAQELKQGALLLSLLTGDAFTERALWSEVTDHTLRSVWRAITRQHSTASKQTSKQQKLITSPPRSPIRALDLLTDVLNPAEHCLRAQPWIECITGIPCIASVLLSWRIVASC